MRRMAATIKIPEHVSVQNMQRVGWDVNPTDFDPLDNAMTRRMVASGIICSRLDRRREKSNAEQQQCSDKCISH